MNRPLSRLATRAAYGASQLPRIAWYLGHGLAMTRIAQRARESGSARPRPHTDAPIPDRKRFFADMGALWRQDLANVEAGVYPLPADHDGSLKMLLHRSRLFFEDLPAVHRRRESGDRSEVLTEETRGKRPRYYLQNFHFQSGGWMTNESAQRYDTQVEVLFNGAANATRRQAVPPLREVFAGRDQRRLSLLDVGCGTGRFLDFVKQTWPRLPALGLDLSEAYVKEAKRHLQRLSNDRTFKGRILALPSIERHGRIEAWIVIDTGFRTTRKRLTVALANPSRDDRRRFSSRRDQHDQRRTGTWGQEQGYDGRSSGPG